MKYLEIRLETRKYKTKKKKKTHLNVKMKVHLQLTTFYFPTIELAKQSWS